MSILQGGFNYLYQSDGISKDRSHHTYPRYKGFTIKVDAFKAIGPQAPIISQGNCL